MVAAELAKAGLKVASHERTPTKGMLNRSEIEAGMESVPLGDPAST